MSIRRSLPFALSAVLGVACATGAAACGSTTTEAADAPAVTPVDDSGVLAHPGPATSDAGRNDARATADGSQAAPPSAWTAETPPQGITLATGASVAWILADPVVPRRLMLKLSSTTNVAVSWEAGAFGPILPWLANYLPLIPEASGGGFAADGSFYGFLAAAPDVTKSQLAVKDATGWSWKLAAPGPQVTAPRSVHVMPGAPVRVFVRGDSSLIEVSSSDVFPPTFPLGAVGEPALAADRTTYLGVTSNTLQRCALATGTCTAVGSTGFGAGDTLSGVAFDPFDGNRILVRASSNTQPPLPRFYYSTNGGLAFSSLPLPSAAGQPQTVPGKPGTFVVSTFAVGSASETIQLTRDFGETWTTIPFPPTKITDLSGLTVDAAGTLYLVREGTLFSMKLR
jgi:hypothetical protein